MQYLIYKFIMLTDSVVFSSIMGDVSQSDLINSLKLMGLGMVAIFVVMILFYVVINILNKTTKK